MDDDEFDADPEFLAALAAADVNVTVPAPRPAPAPAPAPAPTPARVQQPTPQRIVQPTPQRIVQPTPQALPGGVGAAAAAAAAAAPSASTTTSPAKKVVVPSSGSTILVSPRQRGNPVLAQLRTVPWEYSDILADYGLGATTGALFLSLKYHRLHPEYIFARFRGLRGAYRLRVLLALVDIENHEEVLRELAKTALVNQLTLILCWSAAEAARYLELYKTYEHAQSFAAIRGGTAGGGGGGGGGGGSGSGSAYAEHLVRFATVPRVIHKADAVALVGQFGSLRRAVQAEPEQLAQVPGWGERKIQAWRRAASAPFRVHKGSSARRGKGKGGGVAARPNAGETTGTGIGIGNGDGDDDDDNLDEVANSRLDLLDRAIPLGRVPARDMPDAVAAVAAARTGKAGAESSSVSGTGTGDTSATGSQTTAAPAEQLSDGVAAALARLRDKA